MMTDGQFPRPPRDDEEREAARYLLAPRVCQASSNGADGWLCNRAPRHTGKHVAAGTMEIGGPILVLATWPQTPDHSGDVTDMVPAVEISEALAHLDEIGHALRAEGRGHRLESVAATLRRLAGKAPAGTLRGVVGHRFQDGTMIVSIEGTCTVGREGTRSMYVRADELRAEVGQRVRMPIEVDNG